MTSTDKPQSVNTMTRTGIAIAKKRARAARLPSNLSPVVETVALNLAHSPVLEALRAEVLRTRQSVDERLGFAGEVEDTELDFIREPLHYLAVMSGEAQDIDGNLIARADVKFDPNSMRIRGSAMMQQARRNIARTADQERAAGIGSNRQAKPRASSSHAG